MFIQNNVIKAGNGDNTLNIYIDYSKVPFAITEENFKDYFGITYAEYLNKRNSITNFIVKMQMFNEEQLLYDILQLPGMIHKANLPNGSIFDTYSTALTESVLVKNIIIESNEDKTFKRAEIETEG